MVNEKLHSAAIKAQMELILNSRDFQASTRLKDFFRFLVEETLAGRASQLKGYTIATTVFKRPENFDAQTDPIVRVEAAKLRSRLEHYYYSHGSTDSIYITLPKGGYIPEFSLAPGIGKPKASNPPLQQKVKMENTETARASVAVLPFDFRSDGVRADYFSDNLAEEITIHLTKFEDLTVASSYSARQAWAQSNDMHTLAQSINARFILHGSVNVTEERIRIRAELADSETKSNIWAEKFDGNLTASDLFTIQDEITEQVTSRIADSCGLIKRTLLKESSGKQPEGIKAYDAILSYHNWAPSFNRDKFITALEALEQTVNIEPDHALASAMLADIYASDLQLGYGLRPNGLEESLLLAHRAISLNAGCQFAYWALALNYFLRQDLDRFHNSVAQVVPLNPANTYTMAGCGLLIGMAENLPEGLAIMQKAVQLNPGLPSWHHIIPFMVHYVAGEYDTALTEALQVNTPDCFWDPLLQAAAYGRLGMREEGNAALARLLELQPNFLKQQDMLLKALFFSPESVDLISTGLIAAGL